MSFLHGRNSGGLYLKMLVKNRFKVFVLVSWYQVRCISPVTSIDQPAMVLGWTLLGLGWSLGYTVRRSILDVNYLKSSGNFVIRKFKEKKSA